MRCATHPDVETNLTCGKCGKPICPRCLVQTPVGARCRDCAKLKRLPTFEVAAPLYLRAVGTGLGLAVALGIAWGFVSDLIPFIYLGLLIGAGVGYAVGELVALSANRKRGLGLAVIGGFCVALSYFVSTFLSGVHLFDLLAVALGIFIAVGRLR